MVQSGRVGEIKLRVGVVYAAPDAAPATRLSSLLEESGAEIVDADASPPPDGLVVLLSSAAFGEDGWLPTGEAKRAGRLIPVRVSELDERLVPEHLRVLNWIEWSAERPSVTLGFIVAGLLSDPSRYRISRQLAHEATGWVEAGRPAARLIDDRRRARQMVDLIGELESDPLAAPDRVTIEFVAASDRATRKARRRRLFWRGAAAFAVVAAVGAALTAVGALKANSRTNRAAIVTAGSDAVLDQMPEWSAANAAALMLEGSVAQRDLGRSTLLQAMVRRWAISDTNFIDSAVTAATFRDGTRAAVLALAPGGSGFALFDVRAGETLATLSLDRRYESMDIGPDESVAAVAGYGAATIELASGRSRTLTRKGTYVGVAALSSQVALWTSSGRLELRDIRTGRIRMVDHYAAVLDVIAARHGSGGTALVAEAPGRYSIVRLSDGRALVRARLAPGEDIGALDPGGRRAVVDGADQQLWTIDRGGARPIGIATPVSLNDLEWASRERLVIASDSERGQVVFLPRAQRLGGVCATAPALSEVWVEPGGETVACGGDGRSFWRLPQAPLASGAPKSADPPRAVHSPYATIQIRGRRERIVGRGSLGSGVTGWSEPFETAIRAAAFSRRSHQVALGSARGAVVFLGLTRQGVRNLSTWSAPDRSPIVGLRWGRRLLAETASGQTWQVPVCEGCETDRGLIAAARARFTGCFSGRQMTWISDDVRRRLGLRECEPNFVIGVD